VKPISKLCGVLLRHVSVRQPAPFEEERRLMEPAVAREVLAKDGECSPRSTDPE